MAYLQFAHGFICIGMDMEKLGLGRREAALSVLMYYQDLIYILTLRMDPEKRQPH
jgi:hypothetical protein